MENLPLFVGIGGAGCSIAEQVHAIVSGGLARVNATEDILHAWPVSLTIALQVAPRSVRVALDARYSAEEQCGRLALLFRKAPQVILVTGLGGAIGSGATPVIARIAAQSGCSVAVFATLPLAIETAAAIVAEKSIADMRAVCPEVRLHDHEMASRDTANAHLSLNALLALSVRAAVSYSRDLVGATA
jgi:cell division protein FtsZ